jgi:hypothetical protein
MVTTVLAYLYLTSMRTKPGILVRAARRIEWSDASTAATLVGLIPKAINIPNAPCIAVSV